MRFMLFFIIVLIIGFYFLYSRKASGQEKSLYARMTALDALGKAMPRTVEELKNQYAQAVYQAQVAIAQIISIQDDKRTYENTVHAYDRLWLSDLALLYHIARTLEYLSPNDALREAAHKLAIEISNFFSEHMSHNKELYKAMKAYVEGNGKKEILNPEQQYYIAEIMLAFERAGLSLPADTQAELLALDKEIENLSSQFEKNIAAENRTIAVPRQSLAGLDEQFVGALKRTDSGEYILGTDYPTYTTVMGFCDVEDTRKQLYTLFHNRAYPVNKPILEALMAKRHERANLVGFSTYAAYDLANQMAEKPEAAEQFLHNLLMRSIEKEEKELVTIFGESALQEQLKPWNMPYVKEQYKKNTYALDENKLREYFPTEKTIQALMAIYEQFFGLKFVKVPTVCLWHDELYALEVHDAKTNQLLGIFILDLYPRPNKFTHAAHLTIVPAVTSPDGVIQIPEFSVVMANFPRATADTPALLKRSDVNTFFHEFGHAMHALLGRTAIASYSGTNVKTDFVEMPSQMLEEWLWNPEILRMVSSHYKTGESLPEETIAQILKLKQLDAAMTVRRQGQFALLSLRAHQKPTPDFDALLKDLAATYSPHIWFDPDNHFYASFGHLGGYSAKYYGYLWSKVFALDLFGEIQKTGLLDTATGRRYAEAILVPGGTKPPHLLLQQFLGREPRIDAFIKDLGL